MVHINELKYKKEAIALIEKLKNHVIVLDGAMGTMIQKQNLTETDFRGSEYASHNCNVSV